MSFPGERRQHGRRIHRHVQFFWHRCDRWLSFRYGIPLDPHFFSAAGYFGDDLRAQSWGRSCTFLALDVSANTLFKNPVAYTYASPRTGDPSFVRVYNRLVPSTFRIANVVDLVPQLPAPPLYEHVQGLFTLNPLKLFPPSVLIKPTIPCDHVLNSYLNLLSRLTGGPVLPPDPQCMP